MIHMMQVEEHNLPEDWVQMITHVLLSLLNIDLLRTKASRAMACTKPSNKISWLDLNTVGSDVQIDNRRR